MRELREETAYDVELGRLLGIDSHVIPVSERILPTARPMKSVRVMFEGRVVGGDLTHELDGTTDEARWIALADVAELPHVPLVASALRLLAERG